MRQSHPSVLCAGTGLTPKPHLHRDCAHFCTGTARALAGRGVHFAGEGYAREHPTVLGDAGQRAFRVDPARVIQCCNPEAPMAPALPEVERRTRSSVGARSAVLRPTAVRCMLPHRAPLRQLSELSSQFRQEQKAYSQRLQAPSPSSPARSRPPVHSTGGSAPSAFSLRLRMDARGPSHACSCARRPRYV